MRKAIIVLTAIMAPVFSYAAYTGGVLGGALIVPTWYAPDATPYVTISSHTRVSDGGSNHVDIDPIVGFSGPGAGLTDLDWDALGNFPASCAPQCVVAIGTTLTCGDCSGGGGSGGGNAYTTGGVIGQIPVYVAVDSITASGLIPSRVRTTTTAITGADVNADILLSTNPYVAYKNTDNNFSATQTFQSSITASGYIGTSSAYQINGSTVLWTRGEYLYIGVSPRITPSLGASGSVTIGYSSGLDDVGERNTIIGAYSGRGFSAGNANTLLGFATGGGYEIAESVGENNTAIGAYSGYHITSGDYNTLLGYSSGDSITTGSGNIMIGSKYATYVNPPTATTSNYLNIGNEIYGDMTAGPITIKHGINPASVDLSTVTIAIANGAKTNVDNNFSATQTFQQGIIVSSDTWIKTRNYDGSSNSWRLDLYVHQMFCTAQVPGAYSVAINAANGTSCNTACAALSTYTSCQSGSLYNDFDSAYSTRVGNGGCTTTNYIKYCCCKAP